MKSRVAVSCGPDCLDRARADPRKQLAQYCREPKCQRAGSDSRNLPSRGKHDGIARPIRTRRRAENAVIARRRDVRAVFARRGGALCVRPGRRKRPRLRSACLPPRWSGARGRSRRITRKERPHCTPSISMRWRIFALFHRANRRRRRARRAARHRADPNSADRGQRRVHRRVDRHDNRSGWSNRVMHALTSFPTEISTHASSRFPARTRRSRSTTPSSAIQSRVFQQRSRNHALSVVMTQMQNGIIAVDQNLRVILVTPVAQAAAGHRRQSGGAGDQRGVQGRPARRSVYRGHAAAGVYTNDVAARTAVGRGIGRCAFTFRRCAATARSSARWR